jgi:Caspase recruitment domain
LISDYRISVQHTAIIQENYVFLVESLDVKYNTLLLDILISDGVLALRDKDFITSEPSQFRHNEKLLSVLSRKTTNDFLRFVDALDRCNQHRIAEHIRG